MPMPREPDSLRVSTWPIRTVVENSSPSRMVTSASDAPARWARVIMSAARVRRSVVGESIIGLVFIQFANNAFEGFRQNNHRGCILHFFVDALHGLPLEG